MGRRDAEDVSVEWSAKSLRKRCTRLCAAPEGSRSAIKPAPAGGRSFSCVGKPRPVGIGADFGKSAIAGIAMPMQFLGIGKAAFHGFLAPFIDGLG